MDKQKQAEAKIQQVFRRMPIELVDQLVPDDDSEFKVISEATMAWWALFLASGSIRKKALGSKALGGALLTLGALIKYTYVLGLRRGRRGAAAKKRRRG